LVGTPGGGRKKQTGGQSSRKFIQDALADTTRREILAGIPNVSKVPTLEEWKALLQDKIEDADVPAEGTSPHSPEGQMTGSHTSVVTSSSGPQKVIGADTRMKIKAREPLPRSGQPGGNIEAGKSAGGLMISTPLYGVGQGTNSNIQDVEEAQEARGLLERGMKPPSTSGTANPQSPSTAHQYTSPKGPILHFGLGRRVSTHSFGMALSWDQPHHGSPVWGLGGLTQTGPPFSQMVGDWCQWMRWGSLAARALGRAPGVKQAAQNAMLRGAAIMANVLIPALGI
jgi:hypothetical protein